MKYGLFIAGLIAASTISTSHASNAEQVKSNFVISSYAKTKYPLVFAHGMGGWIRAGTDELGVDYWYQILPDLARNGANAWATRVSPFNSSEVRGEQLLQQVDEILAITGQTKSIYWGTVMVDTALPMFPISRQLKSLLPPPFQAHSKAHLLLI